MAETAAPDLAGLCLLSDRLLVREDEPKLDYQGAIIIPEIVRQVKPTDYAKWGTVLLVGPACHEDIQPCDRGSYGKFAGEWITFNSNKYKMLIEQELHCVVDD
mgnify:CR=1 FL=1